MVCERIFSDNGKAVFCRCVLDLITLVMAQLSVNFCCYYKIVKILKAHTTNEHFSSIHFLFFRFPWYIFPSTLESPAQQDVFLSQFPYFPLLVTTQRSLNNFLYSINYVLIILLLLLSFYDIFNGMNASSHFFRAFFLVHDKKSCWVIRMGKKKERKKIFHKWKTEKDKLWRRRGVNRNTRGPIHNTNQFSNRRTLPSRVIH